VSASACCTRGKQQPFLRGAKQVGALENVPTTNAPDCEKLLELKVLGHNANPLGQLVHCGVRVFVKHVLVALALTRQIHVVEAALSNERRGVWVAQKVAEARAVVDTDLVQRDDGGVASLACGRWQVKCALKQDAKLSSGYGCLADRSRARSEEGVLCVCVCVRVCVRVCVCVCVGAHRGQTR